MSLVSHESDIEIINRFRSRFKTLEDMTQAVKSGNIRAMIVAGAPGTGKSYIVEQVLSKHGLLADITQNEKLRKYEVIKGAISALGLYCKLFAHQEKKSIIVLDDCDSLWSDELSLNILKAALDTSKKRFIHWNTDSRLLREEGIPNKFEFKGGAIFITNVKFAHVRSKKLRDHLEAIESRCHYLDLTIDTDREKILRCKQLVDEGMLDDYDFSSCEKEELVSFLDLNKHVFREISLRTMIKLSDLKKNFPDNWQSMAKITLMK